MLMDLLNHAGLADWWPHSSGWFHTGSPAAVSYTHLCKTADFLLIPSENGCYFYIADIFGLP